MFNIPTGNMATNLTILFRANFSRESCFVFMPADYYRLLRLRATGGVKYQFLLIFLNPSSYLDPIKERLFRNCVLTLNWFAAITASCLFNNKTVHLFQI